jgi:hypothetical protein
MLGSRDLLRNLHCSLHLDPLFNALLKSQRVADANELLQVRTLTRRTAVSSLQHYGR